MSLSLGSLVRDRGPPPTATFSCQYPPTKLIATGHRHGWLGGVLSHRHLGISRRRRQAYHHSTSVSRNCESSYRSLAYETYLTITHQPDTDFTFDPESNWFKVICREGDVSCIQSAFRKAQSDIEADVDIEDLKDCDGRLRASVSCSRSTSSPQKLIPGQAEIVDNKWIQAIQDQLLAPSPSKASKSYRCPEAFARYPASRVWLRIEEEAEPGMTLGALLWEGELGAIAQPPEALISHSLCQRIIYIGAASQDAVDCIARKLDTLFDYSVGITLAGFARAVR